MIINRLLGQFNSYLSNVRRSDFDKVYRTKTLGAKSIAHGAKRPWGFGTTDYRLLTFDPDPGIDNLESLVRCP